MLLQKLLRQALRIATLHRPFSKKVFEVAPAWLDQSGKSIYYQMAPVTREEALKLLDSRKVIVIIRPTEASNKIFID